MSTYSIAADVELHRSEDGMYLAGATVHVEGHNLPTELSEAIARHYLAVELGMDVSEVDVFEVLSTRATDAGEAFEFAGEDA